MAAWLSGSEISSIHPSLCNKDDTMMQHSILNTVIGTSKYTLIEQPIRV